MTRFSRWFRRPAAGDSEPFPAEWSAFLWDHSAHYRRLPTALQVTFERNVQRFLETRRITGIEMEADDSLRMLVAASAVTLSLGWQDYKWREVTEVLLYPDSFDWDFTIGRSELAGLAHPWGTVILSVPALRHSFEYCDDPYHVGVHEFAHLLTSQQGIPHWLLSTQIRLWEVIQAHEVKRIQRGESVIHMLGGPAEVEFFACAAEAFFQKPMALQQAHRRLFRFLRDYFGQETAAWEAAFRKQMGEG